METSRHMFEARLPYMPQQLCSYMPGPPAQDRQAWKELPEGMADEAVALGETALTDEWRALPATLYMDYARTGNRVNFETAYFSRRRRLNALIIAECIEYEGRFLDEIANGLWLLCEESGWQLPAHNSYVRGGPRSPLPDPERPVIDLFAAETGALLAIAAGLLENELDAVAPGLVTRIDRELRHRIIRPYLDTHFWWMGDGDEPMNNWTVWCTQNVLWTAFARENDEDVRRAVVKKAVGSIDAFLKDYGEDGACEEGAFYYRHAGLCLFNALETLSQIAPEAFMPLWGWPKIRNIAKYILNVHVSGRYYFNFADCAAVCEPCGAREFLFGLRTGSEALTQFAVNDRNDGGDCLLAEEINLGYRLQALFAAEAMAAHGGNLLEKSDIFYSSIGLFVARDSRFALAVKAGDNGDGHNHNDVGSFILYKDGKPFLIDAGVGSYTSKTFSPLRYEIWTMQSAYHNLPTFEGVMQRDGKEFAADKVEVSLGGAEPFITMDIAGAYPPEAEVNTYRRDVRLIKESHVEIVDRFDGGKRAEVSLMFAAKPSLTAGGIHVAELGEIEISGGGNIRIEEISIEDARLRQSWPNCIYRALIPLASTELTLVIR